VDNLTIPPPSRYWQPVQSSRTAERNRQDINEGKQVQRVPNYAPTRMTQKTQKTKKVSWEKIGGGKKRKKSKKNKKVKNNKKKRSKKK
jgi:hypothetical protein